MSPSAADTPTLFALHGLGLSRRLFEPLIRELEDAFDVVAIDLPGFGDERDSPETSVEQMTALVIRRIRERSPQRWLIAGHSMGGKIASLVAERTMSGRSGLFGLAGVVLLAGSPLSPEPMDEERRRTMLGWVDDGPLDEEQARTFLDQNVGAPLPAALERQTLDDLLRTSPRAWREWLETGSRVDCSGGASAVPALLVAGGADEDLGEDAQRRTNGRTYPRSRLVTLEGAGHLLPLERSVEVAAAIREFWAEEAGTAPFVPADAARAIASARTSSRVRAVLADRALADDPHYAPQALTAAQLTTLRAIAAQVVPQDGPAIDLAARVDAQLAEGRGDGWRSAELPADPVAYGLALDALAGFESAADQDAALRDLGSRSLGSLSAEQLSAWFEDCRVDLVRQWLAHPASLARVGYDGYATGGDTALIPGFRLLGADEREPWEPSTGSHR
ncbi:alpha/beta fold hydrolase [Rathayibacter sp. VKM Ac-2803]|uniref:alpha/beta fold hydrolase n=1 Tax=unclassified Rathayibacter TaxID=2609250 RepID=UPI001356A546|nr:MULTISPECIES: alpha/beta hydrolase [unclassified Rathayibacter]MWV51259.1 alpha/beta fold hydrolase [Rathayibacter sp. VKM Ac-2803]MWV57745.1 alpha/beta fold hydrolase [Rathayibacter sp. VKM Ac-2754]